MKYSNSSLLFFLSLGALQLATACGSDGGSDSEPAGTGSSSAVGGTNAATGSASGSGGENNLNTGGGSGSGSGSSNPGAGGAGTGGSSNPGAGGTGNPGTGGTVDPGTGGSGPETIYNTPEEELMGSVSFSPIGQSFSGNIDVTITSELAGEIHYTLDGSEPTAASPVFSAALAITDTTRVRAVVVSGGATTGDPGSAVYLAITGAIVSDIPIVVLDNYVKGQVVETQPDPSLEPGPRPFFDGTFMSFDVVNGEASLANPPEIATHSAFHVRGQSSSRFPKTPYRLELRGNDDNDLKFPILGMPAQSDWILRGPYADKSLIREAFFYGLGAEMGLHAPKFRLVEFYLNTDNATVDASDYMGVYLLAETIKNSKARLDLKSLDETDIDLPDIAGGYIFKFEWKVTSVDTLIPCTSGLANCWNTLEVYEPPMINAPQLEWITTHVNEFHSKLNAADWMDPTTGYAPMIDSGSFVDQIIINEISREMDSYIRSAFYHKDRDGVIVAGPLWDYNLSFGIGGFLNNDLADGWQYQENVDNRDPAGNDWNMRLVQDPAFLALLKTRWQTLRAGTGLLSDDALEQRVTDLTTPIANAAARNFARWDQLLAMTVIPIRDGGTIGFAVDATADWAEQVTILRTWMRARIVWLDTQWGS